MILQRQNWPQYPLLLLLQVTQPSSSTNTMQSFQLVLTNMRHCSRVEYVAVRPLVPWFSDALADAKRERRRMERKW